jgi:hypothetical protein
MVLRLPSAHFFLVSVTLALLSAPAIGASRHGDRAGNVAGATAPANTAHWRARAGGVVEVFIEHGKTADAWTPGHDALVWHAFGEWEAARLPIRFARAKSAAAADVVVSWVDQLSGSCIGQTWISNTGDEITDGHITLALVDSHGRPIDEPTRHGAALHEIGHLLGLSHSADQESVMFREVWTARVTASDQTAVQALYGGAAAH